MTRPQRRPRARRQAPGSRDRLLDAATALIAERGYAATSVDAVCRRARIAKTALYWHFESKEGLLAEVVERVGTSWIEEIRKLAYLEGDPLHRLDRMLSEWRRILGEQPQLIRLPMVVQLEEGDGSARIREALRTVWDRSERAIVEGIEDGIGRSLPDLDLVARNIVILLQGAVLHRVLEPDEVALDRFFEELRRTVVLAVLARLPEAERAEIMTHQGWDDPKRAPHDSSN